MINFRLSDKTINLLKSGSKKLGYTKDVSRLDLEPRNIYLSENRVIKKETVDRYLASMVREPFPVRFRQWVENIIGKFFKKER